MLLGGRIEHPLENYLPGFGLLFFNNYDISPRCQKIAFNVYPGGLFSQDVSEHVFEQGLGALGCSTKE